MNFKLSYFRIIKRIKFNVLFLLTICFLIANSGFSQSFLTEGFENSGSIPTGWTNVYVTGTQNWAYQSGGNGGNPASAHTGSYNAYFYNSSRMITKLVTPAINFTASPPSLVKLEFWHTQADWVGDQDSLKIYYKTSSSGSWVLLQAYGSSISAWTKETIVLPNPNTTYYIGFEGITDYGRGVCIDDVKVYAPTALDMGATAIVAPPVSGCYGSNDSVIATIKNHGTATINFSTTNCVVGVQVTGASTQTITTTVNTGSLASNSSMNVHVGMVNMSSSGTYNFRPYTVVSGDGDNSNDTSSMHQVVVSSLISTFPFFENFDLMSTCGIACGNPCVLTSGGWQNDLNDDMDWTVDASGTGSSNTGPSNDHTTGTTGNYIYTETSGCNSMLVNLVSPCIDISSLTVPTLRFWYHMYGATMGSLNVDIYANGVWNNAAWTKSGDQGNQWSEAILPLNAYSGIIKIRFRGITGTSFTSDMALDDIEVFDLPLPAFDAALIDVSIDTNDYHLTPLSQVTSYTFSGNIRNESSDTLTYVTFKASVGTYTDSTIVDSLLFYYQDTTVTISNAFVPTTPGSFTIDFNVQIAETDTVTSNDSISRTLIISDTVYSREDGISTNGLGFTSTGIMGQVFEIYTTDTFTSASFYLRGPTSGDSIRLLLYSFNSAPDSLIDSTSIFVIPSTSASWYTISFGCNKILTPGKYFLALEQLNTNNITLGTTAFNYMPNVGYAGFGAPFVWYKVESLGFPLTFLLRANLGHFDYPTADAGSNDTICGGLAHSLSGQATYYNSVQWTTSGGGSFSNSTVLSPTYTPDTSDINSGSVTLTLTADANSPCISSTVDSVVLTIIPTPTFDAGPNDSVCVGNTHILSATASNYNSAIWATSGDGAFNDSSLVTPTYTPGQNDIASGSVSLTLTVGGNTPCGSFVDSMVLNIIPLPTAAAGSNDSMCEGNIYTLSGNASSYSSTAWSTLGDGSFNDSSVLATTYTPGPNDIAAGSIDLVLITNGVLPCGNTSDTMNLSIISAPIVNANVDDSICEGSTYTLSGNASNYISIVWSTLGDGSFNDSSLLAAIYTPGTNDISSGSVSLILSGDGNPPCGMNVDSMVLTIIPLPIGDAGTNDTICEGSIYTLSGLASNYNSSTWSTIGDGGFNDSSLMAATYTPGINDINSGSVSLILTANGNTPCGNAVDSMLLTIIPLPIANSGSNNTICEGSTYTLSGNASSYVSSIWTTSGDGSFDDSSLLAATYTPGVNDIDSGFVQLMLDVNGISPCGNSVDTMDLFFTTPPTADAGSDGSICEGTTHTLSGIASNYSSISWKTSGDGSFDDDALLGATYTPGSNDINSGSVQLILNANGNTSCGTVGDTLELTIKPSPIVDLGADTSICAKESITLDPGSGFDTYLWSTGSSSQTITIDSSGIGLNSTVVDITVTKNGCINTDAIEITFVICGGIDELKSDMNIRVFPNPSNGIFSISIEGISEELILSVISLTGDEIYQETLKTTTDNYQTELDISDLSKGMYFLKFMNKNYIHIERIIIK